MNKSKVIVKIGADVIMEIYVKQFEELSPEELYEIIKIRVAIFCLEQNCLYQDLDDKDKNAYHVYIKENDKIKAYLRVLDKGISFDEISIGRVLTTERGVGFGNIILKEGIRVAKEKMNADKIKIEKEKLYGNGFFHRVFLV